MRWMLLLVALALFVALSPVLAQGGEPPRFAEAPLRLGPAGGEAALAFPFHLAEDAEVYAKVLPTPWNPVLPSGRSNGTAGQEGWWIRLAVEPAGGGRVELGDRADGRPTRAVPLAGGADHLLHAEVHAPAGAAGPGAELRVDLALAQRQAGAPTDPTWALAARLIVQDAAQGPALTPALAWPLLGAAAFLAGGAAILAAVRARPGRGDRSP